MAAMTCILGLIFGIYGFAILVDYRGAMFGLQSAVGDWSRLREPVDQPNPPPPRNSRVLRLFGGGVSLAIGIAFTIAGIGGVVTYLR